jgi:adenosylcobinamide-GDP ribazoletransferase
MAEDGKDERDRGGGPHSEWLARLLQLGVDQLQEFVAALRFLSTIPVPGSTYLFNRELNDTRVILGSAYFPLVALIMATLLSLLLWLIGAYVPLLVLAALSVVALICLTGGLHLDGLMDTCDGLFGGRDRERKLEIMRDSRVGSFGVLGGISLLLLKFALLASLDRHLLPLAFLTGLPVSRWSMVLAVRVFPSARAEGLGTVFRSTVTLPRLLCAGIICLAAVLWFVHLLGLILWAAGSLAALAIGWWIMRTIGGLTGDSYGAIAEVSEVVVLFVFVLGKAWM